MFLSLLPITDFLVESTFKGLESSFTDGITALSFTLCMKLDYRMKVDELQVYKWQHLLNSE